MRNLFNRFVREEEGQDLIEYSLLAALIAVAIVLVVGAVGQNLGTTFDDVQKELKKTPAAQVTPS